MFTSDAQVDRYFAELKKEDARREADKDPDYEQEIIVTATMIPAAPTITNVQEIGVDEGGIVKASGDYLIVLRRGRIFTIRHGDKNLDPVDAIDVFPPGDRNPDDTWYDELLVTGSTILSIGYSYGEDGTEISRFTMAEDGSLSYRDTHYIGSSDYYSSRNYASRLIGEELVFYAPVPVSASDWRDGLPAIRKRMADGTTKAVADPGGADRLGIAARYLKEFQPAASILHAVTRCNAASDDFDCETRAVVGGNSREFYITRDAVYVWTQAPNDWRTRRRDRDNPSMLYVIPDHGDIKAIGVSGAPIDQFSFLQDGEENKLFVMVEEDGANGPMWASEYVDGPLALLALDLDDFGDGSAQAQPGAYRELAPVDGYRVLNRYVGRFLLYGGGDYGDEEQSPGVFVTPLDARWVQKVRLDHGVTRIDKMGIDPVVIGPGPNDALGFSAIGLDHQLLTAERLDTYFLPNADEGENRSQAFYFRSNPGDKSGTSGTLALPVVSDVNDDGGEFLGEASSIFYLRRDARKFSPAGNLYSVPRDPIDEDRVAKDSQGSEYAVDSADEDGCEASCTDWYGNSRPIFLGERIIALLGYELVEGVLVGGKIKERRRVNFAPKAAEQPIED
ncbi:hypothetical protein GCM10022213_07250 [Parerythrobacter jejuensis]